MILYYLQNHKMKCIIYDTKSQFLFCELLIILNIFSDLEHQAM